MVGLKYLLAIILAWDQYSSLAKINREKYNGKIP